MSDSLPNPIRCRQFRALHAEFVDDLVTGDQATALRAHVRACPVCAAVDARVRRAMMAVATVPTLEVSADFGSRLAARLAAERDGRPVVAPRRRWRRHLLLGSLSGAAVAALLFSLSAAPAPEAPRMMAHAPVVVRPAPILAEPVATPALFGTVGSALPVYPAMLMAQRATEHFAATHARTVSFRAQR